MLLFSFCLTFFFVINFFDHLFMQWISRSIRFKLLFYQFSTNFIFHRIKKKHYFQFNSIEIFVIFLDHENDDDNIVIMMSLIWMDLFITMKNNHCTFLEFKSRIYKKNWIKLELLFRRQQQQQQEECIIISKKKEKNYCLVCISSYHY